MSVQVKNGQKNKLYGGKNLVENPTQGQKEGIEGLRTKKICSTGLSIYLKENVAVGNKETGGIFLHMKKWAIFERYLRGIKPKE